jgi:hypothetical protein
VRRRFNVRHKCFGHLFSGRYKALLVDGSGNGYLKSVGDYVHLNLVRAGLLGPEQPLETLMNAACLAPSPRQAALRPPAGVLVARR